MFGIQCTKEAKERLEQLGVLQTINRRLASGPVSVAGINLGRWCDSDLFERWRRVEEEISSGELTASILERDIRELQPTDDWLNHAIFAYTLNRISDSEKDFLVCYGRHSWYNGNHKTWVWNLDDRVLIARANVSDSEVPWINLDSERRRVREMQIDWTNWHTFLAIALQWAGQIKKAGEVKTAFANLDEEKRMSLEQAKAKGYPDVSNLERELQHMFEKPLPLIKRGDSVKIQDFDFHLYGTINSSGFTFRPYILEEDRERKLGFAINPPHPTEEVKRFKKKRGTPLFSVSYERREEPYWRQLQFSPQEMPQLLEGIKKCYNGWGSHFGPILTKFLATYDSEPLVAVA